MGSWGGGAAVRAARGPAGSGLLSWCQAWPCRLPVLGAGGVVGWWWVEICIVDASILLFVVRLVCVCVCGCCVWVSW